MTSHPQNIIVSGGSKGLGQSIVASLLASGHQVATFSRSETDFIAKNKVNPRFTYHSLDAQDSAALTQFVQDIHTRWGKIDTLINNAATAYDGVLPLMNEDHIERMLDINLKAAILLAKESARQMLLDGQGNIINISSIIANRGFSGLSVYAATKAGLIGFTRCLARELGPRSIRVNAVAPGYLDTEMSNSLSETQRAQIIRRTPLGRLGQTSDVVPIIEFLISPGAAYITGQVFTVDGGASL